MLLSSFAKLMVALANLAETEARALREGMLKLCLRACLILGGVVLLLGGLGFMLFGFYAVMRRAYSAGPASLVTGFSTIALAVLWITLVLRLDDRSRR